MKYKDLKQQTEETVLAAVETFYADNHRSPTVRELCRATGLSLGSISNYLKSMSTKEILFYDGRSIVTEKILKYRSECVYAGLLGSVSCGPAAESEEEFTDYYPLPKDIFGDGPLYMLQARGDSMTGAGIEDGDLIVIRKEEEAREGQIVVAWIDGEGNTLKRLKKNKDGILMLHPENPKYDDIPLDEARLQGIAVQIIKDIK